MQSGGLGAASLAQAEVTTLGPVLLLEKLERVRRGLELGVVFVPQAGEDIVVEGGVGPLKVRVQVVEQRQLEVAERERPSLTALAL